MILPKFPRSRRESTGTPAKSELKGVRIFMAKEYKLSPQRLKELQDELTYLKTTREKEVADLIKEARSFGDLSENSEYDEAKNEQGKLYSRIAELDEILSNYVLITDEEKNMDIVHVGNTVTVEDLEFDEKLPGGRPHERAHFGGIPLRQGPPGPEGRGGRGGGSPGGQHPL